MWYCCPNCANEQDKHAKSVSNDEFGIRIGLEDYIHLCNKGTIDEHSTILPLKQCESHIGDIYAKPQDVDASHERLRLALFNRKGGIELEDSRG